MELHQHFLPSERVQVEVLPHACIGTFSCFSGEDFIRA